MESVKYMKFKLCISIKNRSKLGYMYIEDKANPLELKTTCTYRDITGRNIFSNVSMATADINFFRANLDPGKSSNVVKTRKSALRGMYTPAGVS